MATQNRPRAPRAQSKEAYRLWFEFLRRAIAEDKSRVRLDLYKEWGDVESYRFDKWWDEIGSKVIVLRPPSIELVKEGEADEQTYLLRVPKTMTSTMIGNEVRAFLMGLGHQPLQQSTLTVRMGAEIRPSSYRAYIHTYDQQKKLDAKSNGNKVTARELLKAVRKFYLEREKRYKNNLWTVDKLPSALAANMDRDNPYAIDPIHNATAINAVNRYLREANKLIESVRQGKFPN
jgi:hypothetical protein